MSVNLHVVIIQIDWPSSEPGMSAPSRLLRVRVVERTWAVNRLVEPGFFFHGPAEVGRRAAGPYGCTILHDIDRALRVRENLSSHLVQYLPGRVTLSNKNMTIINAHKYYLSWQRATLSRGNSTRETQISRDCFKPDLHVGSYWLSLCVRSVVYVWRSCNRPMAAELWNDVD